MFDKSKIIALVKQKGPVLPVQITKEMNTSPMFAGAMLSELVDNKQLRLSNTKIGSSPVYYLTGQEDKLPALLYNYLHEKEKKAYDLLKSRGIIRDSQEEPVVRVALRAIKDFAVPFEVKKGNDIEIFWKYFLISDNDAERMIREILSSEIPGKQEGKKNSQEMEKEAETSPSEQLQKESNFKQEIQAEKQRESKTEPNQAQNEQRKPHQETIRNFFKQENQEEKSQLKENTQQTRQHQEQPKSQIQEHQKESHQNQKNERKKETKENITSEEQNIEETRIEINEIDLDFSEKLTKYFKDNKIIVEEEKVLRKNSEYEFTLRIPSAVGNLNYICKAKNKKKVSDGDLSSFFVQAQMKKMSGLFLTVGVLTKKAKDLLENEFKSIKVKNIDEK